MLTISGFQWDSAKNASNIRKHGIDFNDAVDVFYQAYVLVRSDRNQEERWIAIGEVNGRPLAVVFTWRGREVRIISARRANIDEERTYRKETMGRAPEG